MSREREITAASYIYKFYTEIQTLNHEYSNYLNVMLELEEKYKEGVEKAAIEEEKVIIKTQLQRVRYSAHQTYIHYQSILSGTKKKVNSDVEKQYKNIKEKFVIDRSELEKYVTAINSVLIEEVIKNLLESSQDLIKELYQDADTEHSA